jgi:hypothetical protein
VARSNWMMFPFVTSLVCFSTGIPWGYLQNICMWTGGWFYQAFSQCKPLLLCGSFSNQIAALICIMHILRCFCAVCMSDYISSSLKISCSQMVQKGFPSVLCHWFSLLCVLLTRWFFPTSEHAQMIFIYFCIRQLKNAWRRAFLSAGMVWTTERLARK